MYVLRSEGPNRQIDVALAEVRPLAGRVPRTSPHQIEQKVKRLPVRSGVSVRTALVYDGRLTRDLQTSDSIDCFVSARMLLGLE